jgi:alpha-2-macroglobulin
VNQNKYVPKLTFAILLFLTMGATVVAQNATLVPEQFLRGYDPVTVFYDRPVGPGKAGPADGPGQWLRVEPAVSGEYRWIDDRTIQFLPAVPWPPLSDFTIRTRNRSFQLTTMMIPPTGLMPAAGSTGLEPFSAITITFPAVLRQSDLERMLSFEVRNLPGVDASGARMIDHTGFTVREIQASRGINTTTFRVEFRDPPSYGKKIIMRLRLSKDQSIIDSVSSFAFETKAEFRLVAFGGRSVRLPVGSDGANYSREQAIDCGTGSDPLWLEFSEPISALNVEQLKRLLYFEPAVRNLRADASGSRLTVRFEADRERPYRLRVNWDAVRSRTGRTLSKFNES